MKSLCVTSYFGSFGMQAPQVPSCLAYLTITIRLDPHSEFSSAQVQFEGDLSPFLANPSRIYQQFLITQASTFAMFKFGSPVAGLYLNISRPDATAPAVICRLGRMGRRHESAFPFLSFGPGQVRAVPFVGPRLRADCFFAISPC